MSSWALWIRAVERIDVPAGGAVPGPLDIEALPPASVEAGRELADGWREWWTALVRSPLPQPGRIPQAYIDYGPLEFEGIAGQPALHRVVRRRWREAQEWHRAHKAGANGGPPPTMVINEVVADVERELGRPVRPFGLWFTLLPVLDDDIRPLGGHRYLVPERVYDGPSWRDVLRPLVLRLGR